MVFAWQLDIFRVGDVTSQVTSGFDRGRRIIFAMEDQGRRLDRRQNVADVVLVVGPHQGDDGPRTRNGALETAEPFDEGRIVGPAWRIDRDDDAFAPVGV